MIADRLMQLAEARHRELQRYVASKGDKASRVYVDKENQLIQELVALAEAAKAHASPTLAPVVIGQQQQEPHRATRRQYHDPERWGWSLENADEHEYIRAKSIQETMAKWPELY